MSFAFISGTGSFLPSRVVTNADLAAICDSESSEGWIEQRTGILTRRFADEGVGTAEMASHASRIALENAGIEAEELDLIILATLSPDRAFPGSGVMVQERLGLCDGDTATFVPALDIRNQCSGFLYGLSVATAQIRAGMAEHVLLVGSETHSAALDLSTQGRAVASLFGDGAGAAVISATDEDRGIRECCLGADGRHADILSQRIWDITKRPFIPQDDRGRGVMEPEMMWTNMEGRKVFKHAVTRMIESLQETCHLHGASLDDIDLFYFHQANLRINQFVAEKLGLDEKKVPHNIEYCGNTTAATIPLLLDETIRDSRLRPGMKIALTVFGSGFSWGSAIIDW